MVKSFSIAKKPRVLFGVGLTTEAPKELKKAGCKNIFVLSDPVLKKMGAFQPLYDALDSEGLDYVICDEFDRDPTDVMVNHVASIAVETKIDGIIGIGGGATMDIAKCVNQLIHSEFPINRYLAPDFATPTPGVPLVLIPTTPGTGSETSSALSLIDTINNVKTGNVTENNIATLAIVDPTYCMTMPDSLTAQSGLDTMCHAVESIVSAQRNHMSTALSLKSFELVWNNLPKALSDENCLEVRAEMSAAGLMAGIAYTDAQVNFGHFIIHALGARYHTPTVNCAVLYSPILQSSAQSICPRKWHRLPGLSALIPRRKTSAQRWLKRFASLSVEPACAHWPAAAFPKKRFWK